MGNPKKVQIGRRVDRFPGGTFNALIEGELRDRQRKGGEEPPYTPSHGVEHQVRVLVQNKTGAALTERFPILALGDSVIQPADLTDTAGKVLRGIAFEADTPDADTGANFVVMQGPCPVDEFRPAVLLGLTWAKVDIADADHTHAIAVDTDDDKLKSAGSGARILWKESGTGTKWAIVLIGSGGPLLQWGKATTGITAATAQAEASWGSGTVQLWDDDGVNDGSTVTIDNPFPAAFDSGVIVCVDRSKNPPRLVSGSCEGF